MQRASLKGAEVGCGGVQGNNVMLTLLTGTGGRGRPRLGLGAGGERKPGGAGERKEAR